MSTSHLLRDKLCNEFTDDAYWNYGSFSAGTHWSFDDPDVNPGVDCRSMVWIAVATPTIPTKPLNLNISSISELFYNWYLFKMYNYEHINKMSI